MSSPTDELKNRLKKALAVRGLKPIDLVEKTNIPKSAISQYMSGYAKPKQDRIYLISKALNINEAWLMGFDVPMEKHNKNIDDCSYKKNDLNENEIKLVCNFRQLNPEGQNIVIDYVDTLVCSKKYETAEEHNNISSVKNA